MSAARIQPPVSHSIADRVQSLDWPRLHAELHAAGWARTGELLTPQDWLITAVCAVALNPALYPLINPNLKAMCVPVKLFGTAPLTQAQHDFLFGDLD